MIYRMNHLPKPILIFTGTLIFLSLFYQCKEKKEQEHIQPEETGYFINGLYENFQSTICYHSEWGDIIHATNGFNEFTIVLSDSNHTIFAVQDSLFSSDSGKARFSLNIENNFRHAIGGNINFDRAKGIGSFTLEFNSLKITNGKIRIDSIINSPCLDFTKITSRDEIGIETSDPDDDDWTFNKRWNTCESELLGLSLNYCNEFIYHITAYPNPLFNTVMIDFSHGYNYIDFLLVNPNMEIEKVFRGIPGSQVLLQLNDPAFSGRNLRLYYHCYGDNDYNLYGYGDLKFNW